MRRARRLNNRDEDPPPELGMQVRNECDGTVQITLRLPVEQATVILAAIDTVRDKLQAEAKRAAKEAETKNNSDHDPRQKERAANLAWLYDGDSSAEDFARDFRPPPPQVSRLESLIHLVDDWMSMQKAGVRRRLAPRLTAQIDPHSGWGRLPNGEFLPPQVTRRLDLTRFDRGRKRREADHALRNLLGVVDGERCRFPGCRHTRHLQAHHVIWWKHGGRTDLNNLVLLCTRHHNLVHELHIRMTLNADRTLTVEMPDGTPLPHRPELPYRPAAELDPEGLIGPGVAPTPESAGPLSLEYAVSVLVHLAA